jgi:hypothetical protein
MFLMILKYSMDSIKSSVIFLVVAPKDWFALMLTLRPYQLTYFYLVAINVSNIIRLKFILKIKYIIILTIEVESYDNASCDYVLGSKTIVERCKYVNKNQGHLLR